MATKSTAWNQVIAGFGLMFNSWGLINAFGVFQEYYSSFHPALSTLSSISWIGSLQIFLMLACGSATGSFVDRGYAQLMTFIGCALVTLGLLFTSFSGEFTSAHRPVYYQVLLSQGVLSGMGMSLLLVPSTAIVPTHFTQNRALAVGLANTGASLGGIVYPVLTRRLLASVGFSWGMRATALVVLATTGVGGLLVRQRADLTKSPFKRTLYRFSCLKDPPYALFVAGIFFSFAGIYIPYFYISAWVRDTAFPLHDVSTYYLISIMNAGGLVGRIIPNFVADKFISGPVLTQALATIACAGPTGLLSALLARQLGLSICVLDAKQSPIEVGGADAITARTQQYLEVASNAEQNVGTNAGILGELLNRGVKCNTSTTYADGEFTSRQSKWWNEIPHTFYNNLLMIGQPYIERHFASHIDVPIYYDEPALSFSHKKSPLSVTVRTAKRTVEGRFCLAADGARSFVRNHLNIGWEGTKPNMVWAVLDCWIDTTFPVTREIVTLQVNGESRMAWIPRERGMQRFYVLLDGEITHERTEASIRRHMAPHHVEFTHVEWFSRFEIKERVASTFLYPTSSEPFILAGDAAHVHSVNGGQGMNTGLSDAFNLIWRLYFLLRHHSLPSSSSDQILSSYDTERRETAKGVIDVAAKLVRSTLADAKGYVELIEKNAGFITGMGVQYSGLSSPLVRESEHSIWKAGQRAPDLWLSDPKGDAVRLYQKLIYGRYLLIIVAAVRRAMEVQNSDFVMLLRLTGLSARRVGVQGRSEDVEEETHPEAFGCSWVKRGEEYAVLVRPDCCIEFVGDVDEVLEYTASRLPGLI
ncbi:hypothetical protein E8E12_004119 [Didymella heteroderae]|uniref:FAD-binding domain-containing protein n=1 Tax=Didymella heteroderae TaxID=1769908 RepID=A0A9P5BYP3_9PLEO|nr:hypothetical protein E8E12_004119 [Didymella heteroderae]